MKGRVPSEPWLGCGSNQDATDYRNEEQEENWWVKSQATDYSAGEDNNCDEKRSARSKVAHHIGCEQLEISDTALSCGESFRLYVVGDRRHEHVSD